MTTIEEDTASLLTLSRADEREGDNAARNRDPRVHKAIQAEIFPGGRNFK
jgi:hypothetical protein